MSCFTHSNIFYYEFLKEGDTINVVFDVRKCEPLDLQTKGSRKIKPFIEESLGLELKPLSNHLKHAYLRKNYTLSVIISFHLNVVEKKVLIKMLKHHTKVIGWTLMDIQRISLFYCMHKITLDEGQFGII